ncbi:MAG: hypothetical protein U0X20_12100 [Caldilineaceae bacterium]
MEQTGLDNHTGFLTGSIDDYLLGLADGIQKAQRQLSQMAITLQPGEAAVTYQIPRVEFELKMSLEVATPADDKGGGGAQLRFRPASPARAGGTSTSDVASTIRGAFVAVPVHGGKPPPDIRITLHRLSARKYEVRVRVASAAGERLGGVEVQFNVDQERSRELKTVPTGSGLPAGRYDREGAKYNQTAYSDPTGLYAGTRFWDGSVNTNADGVAVGVLEIDAQEAPGVPIVTVIDVLGQTETIVFKVE